MVGGGGVGVVVGAAVDSGAVDGATVTLGEVAVGAGGGWPVAVDKTGMGIGEPVIDVPPINWRLHPAPKNNISVKTPNHLIMRSFAMP